ncbi:MAG: RNA pyrophosphohydrolase [Rhodospirillales bacterium]|tara:strand:+ start:1879 stop:2358 length:480 start_codon:yes stop_codon:yes gene_type:complete
MDQYNKKLPYRPCAGVVLFNHKGEVFVGRRIDGHKDAWQLPQGGIEQDEEPKNAAIRELKEEIGTSNVIIIGEITEWLYYDIPIGLLDKIWDGKYRGQKQKWFACRFLGNNSEINPAEVKYPEFDIWKWVSLFKITENIVPFKQNVYNKIILEFAKFVE